MAKNNQLVLTIKLDTYLDPLSILDRLADILEDEAFISDWHHHYERDTSDKQMDLDVGHP